MQTHRTTYSYEGCVVRQDGTGVGINVTSCNAPPANEVPNYSYKPGYQGDSSSNLCNYATFYVPNANTTNVSQTGPF